MNDQEKSSLLEFLHAQPGGRARIVAPREAGYLRLSGYKPEDEYLSMALIDAIDDILGDAVASAIIDRTPGTEAWLSVGRGGDIRLEVKRKFA